MKEIYLDNAATTKPLDCVVEAMVEVMSNAYGNASSLHKMGIVAENKIKESKTFLAKSIGALEEELIFTSGGTESNNLAILGAAEAYKKRGNKLITTSIEHPSVLQVFTHLATKGFEVEVLPVDERGYVSLEALEQAIDEKTSLVSIMHVNNEFGTIQDIVAIGQVIKRKNPQTLFHVDAVQSYTKVPIHVKRAKIDFLSISAHKFYGPKGVGVLYKNKAVRVQPMFFGGGHQKGMRSGTENTPAVVGMAAAAKYVFGNHERLNNHYREQKMYLAQGILEGIPNVAINGPELAEGAPHILNIAFEDVRAEVLLHALEQKGIYVSSGSACSSNKGGPSGPLGAIGKTGAALDNAIRFSFSEYLTKEHIEETIAVLKEQVALLRKYTIGGKK